MRVRFVGLIVVIALLAFAAPASAQTSDAYGGEAGVEQVVGGGGGEGGTPEGSPSATNSGTGGETRSVSADDQSGSLPFTGFQAGMVALLGLALVGTGLAARRVSRTGAQA
jgi:hypothetical protein